MDSTNLPKHPTADSNINYALGAKATGKDNGLQNQRDIKVKQSAKNLKTEESLSTLDKN